jgi:hypothetical protein
MSLKQIQKRIAAIKQEIVELGPLHPGGTLFNRHLGHFYAAI